MNEWIQTKDRLPNNLDIVEFHVLHKSGEEEILKGQYQIKGVNCFVIDGGFWFNIDIVTKWRYAEKD